MTQIQIHGRTYQLPKKPTVAVCVDGFDPEYLDQGIKDGILPNLASFVKRGFHETARCVMPSLTNPNNTSIVTGAPISKHGIAGNYFLDPETWKEEMIVDDSQLIGPTILELMSKQGVRVAAVTAKDKLRKILQHNLQNAICFSAEKAGSCTLAENGIENVEEWLGQKQPSQYSGTLSQFVIDAGIKLLEEGRADLYYLTLSDYIQHKHAPGSRESDEFLAAIDRKLGRIVELGATVAITGDHGMSAKSKADGTPNVLYVEDALSEKWPEVKCRVICPITDPFVKHHGALGGFVRVYAHPKNHVATMIEYCNSLPQVEVAMSAVDAVKRFDLMLEREGDFVVISKSDAVVGSRKEEHDLSNLGDHSLRTHGGLSEQYIPLIMSRPVKDAEAVKERDWRNFDIYDLLLNH